MPIPNEHTDRLERKAREHGIYIQSGSMLERRSAWPGVVFNTTCLIGPEGILYKYRKVNPWIPYEVHASPHDLDGYDDPLFPVADTPIGRIGCAICYDWLFPEAIRQLAANGAEVLVRVSAYMDPWGATEPMNWWTIVNRCRALENMAYVVAANQGASLRHYPPYSWPGGSQVVDFDGRLLAEASPGPGERIVVAPIDITALRHERATRRGHHMLAHLRTEAYPVYAATRYAPVEGSAALVRGQQRADRRGEAASGGARIADASGRGPRLVASAAASAVSATTAIAAAAAVGAAAVAGAAVGAAAVPAGSTAAAVACVGPAGPVVVTRRSAAAATSGGIAQNHEGEGDHDGDDQTQGQDHVCLREHCRRPVFPVR